MNTTCSAEPCPVILNSSCVFYRGGVLLYTGINSGDNIQTALQKIDAKFQDASVGYVFENGVIQSSPGGPVQLGGTLNKNTTINSNGYLFGFTGPVTSPSYVVPSGLNSQFLKADGSLDDNEYADGTVKNVSVVSGDGISATVTNPTTTPSINITNTAPDQIIILNSGSGIHVTGTYPVFTITNTGLPPDSIQTLTVNLPLTSTGGNNPVVSINKSNTSTDGYLSKEDWNYFDAKVDTSRTLTINGISQDLSQDRTWNISSQTTHDVIADVTVGAINAGDTIPIGTDIQELVTQIFSKTFYPTFTAPSFSLSNNAGTREIGSTATVRLTFTYNRGSINGAIVSGAWNPSAFQDYRGGASSSYTINSTTTTNNFVDVSVTFLSSNTYSGTVTYLVGPQPKDSKGNNYSTPLAAGTSASQSTTFTALYPYFYYKSNSPITASSMQSAIAAGLTTKVVGDSTGTITIPFAAAGEYIAVAYPATSTTKTKWYVSALDNGVIPGGVFGSATTLNCTSPSGYWSGISYKIHVSPGLITQSSPIQLQN